MQTVRFLATKFWIPTALCLAVPLTSVAQDYDNGFQLSDRVRLVPVVELSQRYTDNLYYGNEDSEVGAYQVSVKPQVGLFGSFKKTDYYFIYNGDYGYVQTEANDNFIDHQLRHRVTSKINSRNQVAVEAAIKRGHDPFGQVRQENLNSTPTNELDEWRELNGRAEYTFGREEARVRSTGWISASGKKYISNESTTRFLDYKQAAVGNQTFVRISPRTAAGVIAQYQRVRFDHSSQRDNNQLDLLGGFSWELASKTSGSIRAGWRQKRFENTVNNSQFDDSRNFIWDIKVKWVPTKSATFTADTGRNARESYLDGTSYIQDSLAGISWHQQWHRHLGTTARVGYRQSDFVDHPGNREEDLYELDTSFRYTFSKTYTMTGGASYRHRDFEQNNVVGDFDYDRTVVRLGLEASL